jgi:hypothetical protein
MKCKKMIKVTFSPIENFGAVGLVNFQEDCLTQG